MTSLKAIRRSQIFKIRPEFSILEVIKAFELLRSGTPPTLIRDTVTRFLVSLTTRDCGGWEAASSGSYCSAWVAAGYYLEIADLNSKFEHLLFNHIDFCSASSPDFDAVHDTTRSVS